ncbi:MAG: aryl-sulfate sulfotransferase [Acidobacteria bacterium]|nr:aryl-sulfate sulfotransferase [Acidobacteriota bacterium]
MRSFPDAGDSFRLFCLLLALVVSGCGYWINPNATVPTGPGTPSQRGSVTISPTYVALAPGQEFRFTASSPTGEKIDWLVNGVVSGKPETGKIDAAGNYVAPSIVSQGINISVTAALSSSPAQDYATAVVALVPPAQVSCPDITGSPLVAAYSINLPASGKVSIEFGKTTDYGRSTWQVPSGPAGGSVKVLVAGMVAKTLYHMRARVTLDNGATYTDSDHTCTTGTPPPTTPVQTTAANGAIPQPGIELWNTAIPSNVLQAFATDLDGNVIWTYLYHGSLADLIQGIQLLPNGDMLMLISYLSSTTVTNTTGLVNEIREIDLAGNTIRSLTMDDLNQKLAASNLRDADGNVYNFRGFHHSVLALPNGHWAMLTDYRKNFTDLPGYPGITPVLGDAIVDVDQNGNPDWVWNTFDHLDINRHFMSFPDWTHSNGLLYSTDDHNLLLSIRHQNWIIKINFQDGQGSGDVMWRLGEGGDFKLIGGTDPTDWFYAQHGLNYFSPNTTGVYRLGIMDNGNDRLFPSGQVICKPLAPTASSCYSTIPVLELNETNMTATLVTHYTPPPAFFTFFGGNVEQLPNGNIHANFGSTINGGIVQELNSQATRVLWQGTTPSGDQFHTYRWPSLYPGVQW